MVVPESSKYSTCPLLQYPEWPDLELVGYAFFGESVSLK